MAIDDRKKSVASRDIVILHHEQIAEHVPTAQQLVDHVLPSSAVRGIPDFLPAYTLSLSKIQARYKA